MYHVDVQCMPMYVHVVDSFIINLLKFNCPINRCMVSGRNVMAVDS